MGFACMAEKCFGNCNWNNVIKALLIYKSKAFQRPESDAKNNPSSDSLYYPTHNPAYEQVMMIKMPHMT